MIINFIQKHFFKLLVFCFVGGTSAVVYILFFNIFRFWLNFSFIIALFAGVCFSIIYNFSMNRTFTFRAKEYPVQKQLPRFIIVYAISITVNMTAALLINFILGPGIFKENIATVGGIILSIPISFLGSLLWVFKKR